MSNYSIETVDRFHVYAVNSDSGGMCLPKLVHDGLYWPNLESCRPVVAYDGLLWRPIVAYCSLW